jgi:hypothetical protein
MSQNDEQKHREAEPTIPSSCSVTPANHAGRKREPSGLNLTNKTAASNDEFVAELKRQVHENRLPADLREQILANEPAHEILEQMYRDLQENGGLSSEEFLASLGLDAEP